MMNSKLVPKRRFKEFESDGEWEQKNLSSIADIRDGTHSSPKYLEVGHPFITSKNVANGFISFEDIQYISNEDFNEINKRSKVDVHDILMGMIGTVGNLALIRQTPFFAIKNVALIKYTGDVDYEFLYQALQTSNVNRQLKDSIDGGTQKFISLKKIRNLNIPFSNISEQLKIGKFFQTIDLLIQLHQHKLDKLKNLKKAYLTEMFPAEGECVPKRRFPGFEGEWEQRKLGDIVEINSGKDYKHLIEGEVPVYGTGGYMLSVSEALSYRDGIGIGRKGTIDKPYILRAPFWTVDTLFYCVPKEKDDLQFVNAIFERINWRSYDESTGVPSLSKVIINNIQVFSSCIDEQRTIGDFLLKVEKQISLQQQKLDKLNDLKKAYLNELFV